MAPRTGGARVAHPHRTARAPRDRARRRRTPALVASLRARRRGDAGLLADVRVLRRDGVRDDDRLHRRRRVGVGAAPGRAARARFNCVRDRRDRAGRHRSNRVRNERGRWSEPRVRGPFGSRASPSRARRSLAEHARARPPARFVLDPAQPRIERDGDQQLRRTSDAGARGHVARDRVSPPRDAP